MTSIYDIPYEDIKIFLLANNKNIKGNNEDYELSYILLKDKKAKGHTTSIIEWMMAHNLLKVDIPYYTVDQIDSMPQVEINQLSKLLKMKGNNRENIKNILRYLNKLQDEFLVDDINDLILSTLNQVNLQEINIYNLNFNDIIKLLKTHHNKKALRKFLSDNMEKIIGYHSISTRLNDPNYNGLDDIPRFSNIYNKNIMIEIIKDNRETFLNYYTNEEINYYIEKIKKIDDIDEIYIEDTLLDGLIRFTLDLIAIDEIGLAKQTFDIINKFKYYGGTELYTRELVKYAISSGYTNVTKVMISFMGDNEFVRIFDEILRNDSPDSIKEFLRNLVRLKEYDILINILKTQIDYLRHNYRGLQATKIENILEKIEKAIESKDDDLIFEHLIQSIQTILDTLY